MYPNPQDALPLPPRPNLEQYRKRAKDLVRACRSANPDAIRVWAEQWIDTISALQDRPGIREDEKRSMASRIDRFARTKLSAAREGGLTCALADAQFVIARACGFTSWPNFVAHLESLERAESPVSVFEAAVNAVVTGDEAMLHRLLRENPDLVRARSTREHHATLLHYVSANGVETYRQKSPRNAARIAEMLVEAGADVEAEADVYGGGCTTLGLVATSAPPALAGVQKDVIDVLLKYGARMDRPRIGGNAHSLVRACLANGQPNAAEYLVSRGASLDFAEAAGVGRLDIVRHFLADEEDPKATKEDVLSGFAFACRYGWTEVVDWLLDRGVDVNAELHAHGAGHTGLHVAAYHGHAAVVAALLRRGAGVDVTDKTWGTSPLIWALTGWSREPATEAGRYYDVVARLVAAGAHVRPDLLEWDKARADLKMLSALSGDRGGQ